jgi:hypothetical protein
MPFVFLAGLVTDRQQRQRNTEPEAVATGSRFGSPGLASENDPVATTTPRGLPARGPRSASGSVFFDPLWRSMPGGLLVYDKQIIK